jgi:hypothetical protein
MKKNYVTPSLETIEINNKDAILQATSNETTEGGTTEEEGDGGDLANKNRNQWGNIWDSQW